MSTEGWKKVFLSGAFFNWIFAAFITVAPGFAFDILDLGALPENPIWLALFVWLVVVFGYGYYRVSKNPVAHRDIAILGTMGKLGVFAIIAGCWFIGLASTIFLIVVGGDLVYSLLFIWFLQTAPKEAG